MSKILKACNLRIVCASHLSMLFVFFKFIFFLFLLLQVVVGTYIIIPFLLLILYLFVMAFRIRSPFEKRPFLTSKEFHFGIVITAHQDVRFILPAVDSILKQEYRNFTVYVVADDCKEPIPSFNDERVVILEPEIPLHSKISSIQYAVSRFDSYHDALVILDADNLLHPKFLNVVNQHFQKGYRVVQADFKPKNTDTIYARMDAIGDLFNFFVEREARMRLGLSAAIWGSGITIDLDLYREVQYSDKLGGFDKKLQAHLVQRVDQIAFAPEAIVYDEKVSSGKSLEKQRTRWIHSYFKYFGESKKILQEGIARRDFNLAYFGFITLRPPLFIILGSGIFITLDTYFIGTNIFQTWLAIMALFLISFVTIVVIRGRSLKYLGTLIMMPLFMMRQVAALLHIGRARKSFLKTTHHKVVFIEDVMKS